MGSVKRITSLSAGYAIRAALAAELGGDVTGIYPVVSEQDAKMPYVVYYRTGVRSNPAKGGNAFDSCVMEVEVYSKGYGEGVELAERCRAALECAAVSWEGGGERLRVGCGVLADCEESWSDDAYRQALTVECKIL